MKDEMGKEYDAHKGSEKRMQNLCVGRPEGKLSTIQ
jgi:hypothetical protein